MIDSTGLSIHGEGKWTRHKHGKRKRRGWRKLHIATGQNGMIHAASLSLFFYATTPLLPRRL